MKLKFCAVCGNADVQHHHFVPKIRGGSNKATNMLTLCDKHHYALHDMRKSTKLSHRSLVKEGQVKARKAGQRFGPAGKTRIDTPKLYVDALDIMTRRRYPERDRVLLILLCKKLMLHKHVSKMQWDWISAAGIVVNDPPYVLPAVEICEDLQDALDKLEARYGRRKYIIFSDKGSKMCAAAVTNWRFTLYKEMGLLKS